MFTLGQVINIPYQGSIYWKIPRKKYSQCHLREKYEKGKSNVKKKGEKIKDKEGIEVKMVKLMQK